MSAGGDRTRTIFFGSGVFALPILEAAFGAPELNLVAVVTVPDQPVGRASVRRSTPVGARGAELGVPVLKPAQLRDAATIQAIADLRSALGVLADYGRIVPQVVFQLFGHGILNVHPSLLPRHRGASPISAAILAGDPETGVTIIRMDAGLDTGPIVAVDRLALHGTETAPELEGILAGLGAKLLKGSIGPWLRGELEARPQSTVGVSLTRPLRREDGRIDPARPAAELERAVRAHAPWPGAFLDDEELGRIAVVAATLAPAETGDRPARLVPHGDGLALTTGEGRLVLNSVVPAGGRRMTGAEFRRGRGRSLFTEG